MGDEHGYSDEEVAKIMERAAELQADQGSDRRLSIAEVEAVAREAGIDRALVRRAAAELALARGPGRNQPSVFLGGPKRIELEAVIPGELDTSMTERFVELARRAIGDTGEIKTVGRTMTWETRSVAATGNPMSRRVVLTVIPRDGVTRIRLEEGLTNMAGPLFGGVLGGVGGGGIPLILVPLAVMGVGWLAPFGIAAWVGGAYALVRRIYRSKAHEREAELRALLRELVATSQGDATPELGPAGGE